MTYGNYFILFRVSEQGPLEFREKAVYVSSRMPVVGMKRDQFGCEEVDSSVVGRRYPGSEGRLIKPYNLSLCQLNFFVCKHGFSHHCPKQDSSYLVIM